METPVAAADADNPVTGQAPLQVGFGAQQPSFRFAFADGLEASVRILCERLAGPREPESWRFHPRYRMLAQEVAEPAGDIEAATRQGYASLLARVRGSTHPWLLRIWNYLGAINAGHGDEERYRRFCVGRAAAVDAAFNDPPPAATAIGHDGGTGTLQIVALCSNTPALALENPRQTPAWSYPRQHGPVSPGFSRGALLDAEGAAPTLLASGTASIVGHVSRHVDDPAEQLRESLRNLDALLEAGSQRAGRRFGVHGCQALRIYLRRPTDLATAQAVMAASGVAGDRAVYLRGDVCRRELDVEIEGVFESDPA